MTRFLALLLAAGACAHPATVNDPSARSAQCRALTEAAPPDSQTIDVGLTVHAFDLERDVSRDYGELVATGIRQFLVLPKPLTLDTYDESVSDNAGRRNHRAALTLTATYRATLRRDGRVLHARPVGGVTTPTFDQAMLTALVALDSSGLLPKPPDGADWFWADTAALVIRVRSRGLVRPKGPVTPDDTAPVVPLMRLRVPVEPLDHGVRRRSGPLARYPQRMKEAGEEGKVMLQFVVDIDGTADMETMRVLPPIPRWDFVNAALQSMTHTRYEPMVIRGCPVRSLVEQPYVFGISGPTDR